MDDNVNIGRRVRVLGLECEYWEECVSGRRVGVLGGVREWEESMRIGRSV